MNCIYIVVDYLYRVVEFLYGIMDSLYRVVDSLYRVVVSIYGVDVVASIYGGPPPFIGWWTSIPRRGIHLSRSTTIYRVVDPLL